MVKNNYVTPSPSSRRGGSILSPYTLRSLSSFATQSGRSVGKYLRDRLKSTTKKSTSFSLPTRVAISKHNRVPAQPGSSKSVDTKRTNKGGKMKKVKKLKISGKFKKKVKQALDGTKPQGNFEERHYGLLQLDQDANYYGYGYKPTVNPVTAQFTSNQAVFAYANLGNMTTDGPNWSFSNFKFSEFIDALQVLFYEKINRLKIGSSTINNFEVRGELSATHVTNLPENYAFNGIQHVPFKVINSSVTYNMKNNTNRTLTLHIHRCMPKQKIMRRDRYPLNPLNGGGADYVNTQQDIAIDAYFDWLEMQEQDFRSGQNLSSVSTNFTNSADNGSFIAPGNANGLPTGATVMSPWYPGASPKVVPLFNGRWKVGTTKVVLEPGQTYSCYHQGPKNAMFNAKQWSMQKPNNEAMIGEGLNNFCSKKPGWSEDVIITVLPDLLPKARNNGKAAGYYGVLDFSGTVNEDAGIAIECIKRFKLEMPETVGGIMDRPNPVYGAGGTSLTDLSTKFYNGLNLRKKSNYFCQWKYGDLPTTGIDQPTRVDDNNPVDREKMDES